MFLYAFDNTSIFRLDGAEELSRSHLEYPGIASLLPLSTCSQYVVGNRVEKGMKTGNLGADKKK